MWVRQHVQAVVVRVHFVQAGWQLLAWGRDDECGKDTGHQLAHMRLATWYTVTYVTAACTSTCWRKIGRAASA